MVNFKPAVQSYPLLPGAQSILHWTVIEFKMDANGARLELSDYSR